MMPNILSVRSHRTCFSFSYDRGHYLFESWAWACMMEESNSNRRMKEVKSKQKNGRGSLVLYGKTI